MRKERWLATALVASAVWIGVLAGCGGNKAEEGASSTVDATPPAPAGDTTAAPAGGGAPGEVSLALGEKVVQERCVPCHGESGKGDGPAGQVLNPKPRNWTDHALMGAKTDAELYDVIFNGKGSMPAWGKTGILTETEIRSAIMKVRTFDPQYKGG